MSDATVLLSRDEVNAQIAILTLNRPRQANALSRQLVTDLATALTELEDVDDWDVLVVTGAGKHFCGGADLRDEDRSERWLRDVRRAFDRLEALPRPTIAAINGAAMGGGCELALACDLRVIGEQCIIGVPEIKIGALAVAGGTQRLPRVVGPANAKELLYTGEPIDASEALRIGLVNRVAPEKAALPTALTLARTIASRSRPALELAKLLTSVAEEVELSQGLVIEAAASRPLLAELEESMALAAQNDSVYGRIIGG